MSFRRICDKCRAMTLLEVVMAASIGSVVLAASTGLLIYGSKMARAAAYQNRLDAISRTRIERLKNDIRMAANNNGNGVRVLNGGDRLELTFRDGTPKTYYYVDTDSNSASVHNNNMMVKLGLAGTPEVFLSHINRSINRPMFTLDAGAPPAVGIRIRFGDPVSGNKVAYPPPGIQAVDIETTAVLRNN